MPESDQPSNNPFAPRPGDGPATRSSGSTGKPGCLLWAGIFFIPYVFSWFTLRKGTPTWVRIVAFGWLLLLLPGFVSTLLSGPPPAPQIASAPGALDAAPAACAKCLAEPESCSVLFRKAKCGEALSTAAGVEAVCRIVAGDDAAARAKCFADHGGQHAN